MSEDLDKLLAEVLANNIRGEGYGPNDEVVWRDYTSKDIPRLLALVAKLREQRDKYRSADLNQMLGMDSATKHIVPVDDAECAAVLLGDGK